MLQVMWKTKRLGDHAPEVTLVAFSEQGETLRFARQKVGSAASEIGILPVHLDNEGPEKRMRATRLRVQILGSDV